LAGALRAAWARGFAGLFFAVLFKPVFFEPVPFEPLRFAAAPWEAAPFFAGPFFAAAFFPAPFLPAPLLPAPFLPAPFLPAPLLPALGPLAAAAGLRFLAGPEAGLRGVLAPDGLRFDVFFLAMLAVPFTRVATASAGHP
jgi:hypothetical protein